MKTCLAIGVMAMILIIGASAGRAQLTSAELAAAGNGELPVVPAGAMPLFGSFFSWQRDWQAPLPFDFYPDLPLYDLGNGRYLLDDRSISYESSSRNGMSSLEADGPLDTSEVSPEAYGCGLWLSISRTATNAVILTLHNTRAGQAYTIWSITNLLLTNWIVETNLTGASGDMTAALIAMGGRSNLFFRASEYRDYVLNTNATFTGLSYSDTGDPGIEPPDTMGAVGPNHFVELLNGNGDNGSIAVYDKLGHMVAQTNTISFFAVTSNGTNYPTSARIDDVRILYDWQAQRWVASGEDSGSQQVLLAVSSSNSPTNLISGWSRYLVDLHRRDLRADFPTLGLDANGLYVTAVLYGADLNVNTYTNSGHTVVAIKKPEIYQGAFIANHFALTNGLPVWMIQPTVNFDDVPTNGYAWFVVKGPPEWETNYQGGALCYRRLRWEGTNAVWADTDWTAVTNSVYRDYYDLDGTNTTALQTHPGVVAPAGPTNTMDLSENGSRLSMVAIRDGSLWVSQVVGLSGTNGTYVGDETGTNVDRSAIQWLKLSVDSAGLSYSAHGRIYDSASTNPFYYYFPSLMVNCSGDIVMGFSGSSETNYIGSYYSWRLANGLGPAKPRAIRAGTTNYLSGRWGDYSATTLDPTDDWSFWTVQEYADPAGGDLPWRTVITNIKPAP